jgi:hypothetical protein
MLRSSKDKSRSGQQEGSTDADDPVVDNFGPDWERAVKILGFIHRQYVQKQSARHSLPSLIRL